MRLFLMSCALGTMLLAGCTARVTPPKVEVEAGAPVTIDVRSGQHGRFCPPGQAKKGNC